MDPQRAQELLPAGLLKVDQQRRALLFEGDKERWAIPAESILSCKIEEYTELAMEENKHNLHAVVVLVANVEGRPWEAPLRQRYPQLRPWHADRRRHLAAELHERLKTILPEKAN